MPIKVHIPTPMRQHTGGNATVEVRARPSRRRSPPSASSTPTSPQRMFDGGQLQAVRQRLSQRRGHPLPRQPRHGRQGRRRAEHHPRRRRRLTWPTTTTRRGRSARRGGRFPGHPGRTGRQPAAAGRRARGRFPGRLRRRDRPCRPPPTRPSATSPATCNGSTGPDLQRTREDMAALLAYAKQQGWEKQLQHFLKTFLADLGVGGESES